MGPLPASVAITAELFRELTRDDVPFRIARVRVMERLACGFPAPGAASTVASERVPLSSDDWTSEVAPLAWYAEAIADWLTGRELHPDTYSRLMRAANYYGDSELAIAAAEHYVRIVGTPTALDVSVVLARAFNDRGDFESGRSLYRKALISHQEDAEATAFLLLLLAKLSDHYHQRVAWHRALHEFSYERLHAAADVEPRVRRWHQIAADCLAKVVYDERPSRGEELYAEALGSVMEAHEVTQVTLRILFKRGVQRILSGLGYGSSTKTLEHELRQLSVLVDRAQSLGNLRAWYVRRYQYYSVVRKVLECNIPIESATELGERALHDLPLVVQGAMRFSDTRTIAQARLELSQWRLVVAKSGGNGGERGLLESNVADLQTAYELILTQPSLMFRIWHNIQTALGRVYAISGQWAAASSLYEHSYELARDLVSSVQVEEAVLERSLTDSSVEPLPAEVSVLTRDERGRLLQELRHDYRLLLSSLFAIADDLRAAQTQQIAAETAKRLRKGLVRNHDVASAVRRTRERVGEPQRVVEQLSALLRQLEEWRNADATPEPAVMTELESEIRRAVASSPHRVDHEIDASALSGSTRIVIWPPLITMLLNVTLDNAIEAARASARERCQIRLGVTVAESVAYLLVADNAGSAAQLQAVVERLNNSPSEPVTSTSGSRGIGLRALNTLIRHEQNLRDAWCVRLIDQDWKELQIPLARLS